MNRNNIMKKSLAIVVLTAAILAFGISTAGASARALFAGNLSFGIHGSPDVTALQQFLKDQGVYSGPITGNFFSLTLAAVKQFQVQNGITPASGYFGPMTRAKANSIVASGVAAYDQQFMVASSATPSTLESTTIGPMTANTTTTSPQVGTSMSTLLQARIGSLFQQVWNLQGFLGRKNRNPATSTPTSGSGGSGSSTGGGLPPATSTPSTPTSTTPPLVAVLPAALPAGTVGVPYSQILTASTTATGSFAWNLISGALPAGLALSASSQATAAVISGTPTVSGTFNFTVAVTNGTSSSTEPYALTIAPKPTSALTVAVSVNGGSSTAANFDLTVRDGATTVFSGNASPSRNFTITQGDTYSVAEATTSNALYYAIALGANCSGTMNASAVLCTVTNTYAAPPVTTPTSTTPTSTVPSPATALQWGAYVGDGSNSLSSFESLVGAKVGMLADFEDWSSGNFPSYYASAVGAAGKTLVIFWEPQYNFDTIISGKEDAAIAQFAAAAKTYGYPVILAPFDEMNLNENTWGAYQGTNTPAKLIQAWQHVYSFFAADTNVKFAWVVNNVSIPDTTANSIASYYPGSAYVDYVGMDGFNFGNPTQSFGQIFDSGIAQIEGYGKLIYIFSTASVGYSGKAAWITEGLGTHVKTYPNIAGWIWFNQNDAAIPGSGDTINWTVNSDSASLAAFRSVLP
jgi:hypothetical protein